MHIQYDRVIDGTTRVTLPVARNSIVDLLLGNKKKERHYEERERERVREREKHVMDHTMYRRTRKKNLRTNR